MSKSRWTVFFARHDATCTRSFTASGTVLRFAGAAVGLAAAALIAAAIGLVSHSVDLSRSWELERTHQALAGQVTRLDRRLSTMSDSLAVVARGNDEARLVAGLDPLSPQVLQAGIGGPPGAWPDRDRLLTEAGTLGRAAFQVHTDLDALLRRADIIATSFKEAADTLTARYREIEATPSVMPTAGYLSSRFAAIRYHPILHKDLPHEGIDVAAAYGARILAPAAGRVVKVGWDGGYGLLVVIDHGYGIETRYAHMSRTAAQVGEMVQRGDLLGWVGSTGLATGPHLHYEVRVNGRPVDPLRYILPDDYGD